MTHRERELPDEGYENSQWESIARLSGETAGPDEAAQARARLAANPADAELLELLNRSIPGAPGWDITPAHVEAALRQVNARRAESVQAHAPTPPRLRLVSSAPVRRRWAPLPVASAAAIVLVSAVALWPRLTAVTDPNSSKELAVTTRAGERASINLADGTRIVVAPLSTIKVPAESQYGKGARAVELTGQALFEVRHNADRLFIVRTPTATVEDIGTTFTVRDEGADSTIVRVTEGSVRLRSRAGSSADVTLVAGDVGILHGGSAVAQRGGVTARDTAWTQGALEFRDAPMNEVRDQIRRWYGVRLRVADDVLERRHVTATLDDEPVDRALQIIALALGAEIERQGDTAVVRLPREAASPK